MSRTISYAFFTRCKHRDCSELEGKPECRFDSFSATSRHNHCQMGEPGKLFPGHRRLQQNCLVEAHQLHAMKSFLAPVWPSCLPCQDRRATSPVRRCARYRPCRSSKRSSGTYSKWQQLHRASLIFLPSSETDARQLV